MFVLLSEELTGAVGMACILICLVTRRAAKEPTNDGRASWKVPKSILAFGVAVLLEAIPWCLRHTASGERYFDRDGRVEAVLLMAGMVVAMSGPLWTREEKPPALGTQWAAWIYAIVAAGELCVMFSMLHAMALDGSPVFLPR